MAQGCFPIPQLPGEGIYWTCISPSASAVPGVGFLTCLEPQPLKATATFSSPNRPTSFTPRGLSTCSSSAWSVGHLASPPHHCTQSVPLGCHPEHTLAQTPPDFFTVPSQLYSHMYVWDHLMHGFFPHDTEQPESKQPCLDSPLYISPTPASAQSQHTEDAYTCSGLMSLHVSASVGSRPQSQGHKVLA